MGRRRWLGVTLGWSVALLLMLMPRASTAETTRAAPASAGRSTIEQAYEQQIYPLLTTYCTACHSPEKHKGDIDFTAHRHGSAEIADKAFWKTCIAKLSSREMPPEKATRQPSDDERARIVAWFASVKRLSPRDPGPGVLRRLSRIEYANSLHDLLGVDPAVAADLPADSVGEGFNSTISPLLMEKYLLVADEVLDQLIKPEQMTLKWNAGQLDAIIGGKAEDGKSDGAERHLTGAAEIRALIPAPVDGSYTIHIRAAAERAGKEPARLAVRFGNQVMGEIKITASVKFPATYSLTCKLAAGKAHLSVLMANPFVENEPVSEKPKAATPARAVANVPAKPPTSAPSQPAVRTVIIESIEIVGPPGTQPSEAQRRLFIATPGKDLAKRDAARRIAESFARRAFRRPLVADEIDVLLQVFDLADNQDEVFSESVKLMLKAVLVSPQFLFIAADDQPKSSGDIVAIADHQLAARLSYLFWATMPDDELAALADAGTLHDPATLAQQIRRVLGDPRAHAFFDGFGAQWLGLDKLNELAIDEKKFPLMTKELRKAMYDEAAMLFATILREDRSIVEFLDCDYTFLNGPLARIYGLDATVKGPQLRRVELSEGNRGGMLTMPGVLAVNSLPGRTSPVKRGRWVLEQILGQTTPPPPMNVAPLEKQDSGENALLNLRQRTERHRADPACAGCHQVLDPIGFGLENFDPIGRWRDQDDTGHAVDATGELPGKIVFRTPQDLKRIIAARKDDFCRALVGKILAYALCRHLEDYDEVVADDIAAAVAKDGYRFQGLLLRVATSYPFLNRRITR